MREHDIARQLPLKPAVVEILLVLAEGARQGSDIPEAVAARNAGRFTLESRPLYDFLERLVHDGLVAEVDDRPKGQHPRWRTYSLTRQGRWALRTEAGRLAEVVNAAKAHEWQVYQA